MNVRRVDLLVEQLAATHQRTLSAEDELILNWFTVQAILEIARQLAIANDREEKRT